jgi:hypothetical protein
MPMLTAALRLAQTFPIFPVAIYRDGDKVAKQPITPHGFKSASRDPAQIIEWWSDNPIAMWTANESVAKCMKWETVEL